MAKRQTKRKVVIRYVGRNPQDPLALLEAVEEAFRPKDIEISVENDSESSPAATPNEQLETQARESAAEVLDDCDKQVRESNPKDQSTSVSKARQNIIHWLSDRISAGWKLVVKILPTLQKIKELFD